MTLRSIVLILCLSTAISGYSKETSPPIVARVTETDTFCDNVSYRLIVNANKERVEHEYCEADKATLHKLADSMQATIDTLRSIVFKQQEVNTLQKQNTAEQRSKANDCADKLFVFEQKAAQLVKDNKKDKRKSFWKGLGIGLGTGLIGGITTFTILALKL